MIEVQGSCRGIPLVKCQLKECGQCAKRSMKQGKGEDEFGQLPRNTSDDDIKTVH